MLGNPLDTRTTLGSVANRRFADTMRGQLQAAGEAGMMAHLTRLQSADGGAYLSPQILTRVDHTLAVMRDESFGPVSITAVEGDDEAIRLTNDSPPTGRLRRSGLRTQAAPRRWAPGWSSGPTQ